MKGAPKKGASNTRQTFIHIHQSIFTVSNSKQVYCILNNRCMWINLSCGPKQPHASPQASECVFPAFGPIFFGVFSFIPYSPDTFRIQVGLNNPMNEDYK